MIEPTFGIIPLDLVVPSLTNPRKRFNDIDLQELARSIKQHGVGQPILVRPLADTEESVDRVEIVAGERRYRASKLAGMDTIPAIVRTMSDIEAREFQVVENLQREDVHPIEEAEGFDSLMKEFGLTADQLVEKTGKSRGYIYGRLKLLNLCDVAKESFFEGKLSASTALIIARIPAPTLQSKAAAEIISNYGSAEPMSARRAADLIQNRFMIRLSTAEFKPADAKLIPVAGSCETCPKLCGNQPELYPDVKDADVCTDPDCFASKKDAHHAKRLAIATKKKLPVFDGIQAFNNQDDENLVPAYQRMDLFDRLADSTPRFMSIESQLDEDQFPPMKAVIKQDNGRNTPVFEKSAVQAALEKAGLALTIEKHAAMIQDKLHSRDGENDDDNDIVTRTTKIDPNVAIAENESAYLAAVYDEILEKIKATDLPHIYRIIAKYFLLCADNYIEFSISNARKEQYDFDISDRDATKNYLDECTPVDVLIFYFDIFFSDSFVVQSHQITNGIYSPDEDEEIETEAYLTLFEIAKQLKIDVDAIRNEVMPPMETPFDASEPPTTKTGKKKSKAPKAKEDKKNIAWPFPTSQAGAGRVPEASSDTSAGDEIAVDTKTLSLPGLDPTIEEKLA